MPIQIRVVIPKATPTSSVTGCVEEVCSEPGLEERDKQGGEAGSRKTYCGTCRGPKTRPVSAPPSRVNLHLQVPARPHDVSMHVASIYDVENEHDYIMNKALQAYSQHCRIEEEGTTPRVRDTPKSARQAHSYSNNGLKSPHHPNNNPQRQQRRRTVSSSASFAPHSNGDGPLSPTASSSSSSSSLSSPEKKRQSFRLSLCTLKDAKGGEPAPVPHSHSSPGPNFLPLQRPWSASPAGRLDAIRQVSLANNVVRRAKTARPVHQYRLPHRNPTHLGKMDPPISRSTAYHIRNRTTHPWASPNTDDGGGSHVGNNSNGNSCNLPLDPMTMSCPSARSLEEHMRHARSHVPRDPNPSPVIVKGRALVSPSSPQPGSSRERPSSAYSYDGGLFLSASSGSVSGSKEFFVIHPDWVSEAITVQKLSLNQRQGRPPSRSNSHNDPGGEGGGAGRSGEDDPSGKGRRLRRCKSAPPAKCRNPMAWTS